MAIHFDRMDLQKAAETLGEAVHRRRRALGLTQKELSRLAGCGLAFLYDLEHGKSTVRLDKTLAVLDVLGLELVVRDGRAGVGVDQGLR